MSSYENEIPDHDDEGMDEEDEVSDVEYEDEQSAVNDSNEFRVRFGFDHECHCAEDWAVGNLGVVAVCYLNMCREAMDTLAITREELAAKDDEISALRIQLADAE